ncbi:MAG: enoyl-[acyl-carrier-protein] reductase FabL [Chloroflexi bacterium]|nr:MAG: enoyl-[acyl-carrier-protein] reductase FabL [Chloroflexota bacterium]
MDSRVALVTGSSRGIGRAIAVELARRGADVVVHYLRKKSAAAGAVAEIEALGRRAIAVKANLADAAQIDSLFDQLEAEFGRCDILVGNAASGTPRDILDVTDKHWDWTMDVNARSILRCAQRAAPLMAQHGWGRIVNISSPGSRRVLPHYAVIGLSKAVVESLTRYLAVELAPQGIVVNAVSPGLVNTDAVSAFPVDLQEVFDYAASRAPAGRLVSPEDVARVVAFLCSDGAEMIVGQTITVDGGYQLLP